MTHSHHRLLGVSRASRPIRWLVVIAFLALAALATHRIWLPALGGYLVQAEPPAHSDIIVVLAGDFTGNRILTSGDLVRRGFAPKALVSGPAGAYGQHECDLAIPFATRHGFPESYFIPMPHDARSTTAEAEVIIPELRRRHARKIELVTSSYHTRRAWKAFRSQAQDLEFHMVEAPDRDFTPGGWWKTRDGRKVFLNEWMKTVATWVGM
jgi:uncharacterized SAM-binding protein YcdF (DUF218 family)